MLRQYTKYDSHDYRDILWTTFLEEIKTISRHIDLNIITKVSSFEIRFEIRTGLDNYLRTQQTIGMGGRLQSIERLIQRLVGAPQISYHYSWIIYRFCKAVLATPI